MAHPTSLRLRAATAIGSMALCILLLAVGKFSWNSRTRLPQPQVVQRQALGDSHSSDDAYSTTVTAAALCDLSLQRTSGTAADGGGTAAASSRNLTIVTAFINIGLFPKGSLTNIRGPTLYRHWMRAFSQVHNAVVAYFDDPDIAESFARIRAGLPTRIVVVSQHDATLWSFSLKSRVEAVFALPGYPQIPPQTTSAAYVCAMHAKFDFVEAAARENYFGTRHIAWMDLGLFRELAGKDGPPFVLQVPLCYRDGAVAFSQVYEMASSASVSTIMLDSINWVSGAFFMADIDTMAAFARDYRRYTEALLDRQLASHDQSIILAMYSPRATAEGLPAPAVPLQAFQPDAFDPWFYIPYEQRREWLQQQTAGASRLSLPVTCSSKIFT